MRSYISPLIMLCAGALCVVILAIYSTASYGFLFRLLIICNQHRWSMCSERDANLGQSARHSPAIKTQRSLEVSNFEQQKLMLHSLDLCERADGNVNVLSRAGR